MSLLAPALLAGLIALAIPVAAHLLGRDPPRTIRFAAVRFLPNAEQSVTHRRSVRDIFLLLIRLLLLGLLILVLARPATYDDAGVAIIAEPHDAVILVDGSRSMELRVEGDLLITHAAERAYALLESLPAGSRVGLMTSDPDGPQLELTADPQRVRAAIAEWVAAGAPRAGAWRMQDAVVAAAALLSEAGGKRPRAIYAIGDATPDGLGSLPAAAEGGIVVVPIPAVDDDIELPEHLAIVAARWEPAPDLDPRAVRIEAVVKRIGPEPEDDAPPRDESAAIGLFLGDVEVARATVEVPLGVDIPVEFTHTLLDEPTGAPATIAFVEHTDDAMPSDNRRHVWLSADEGMEVVVVNGDPSELRAHDEVFFLTTAVAAADQTREISLRSLAPDQLEEDVREGNSVALRRADVLVLANVRAPSPNVAPAIVERVEQGMGLWITVGDRVDAEAYNSRLGKLLPLRMREAVQVGTLPGRTEARVEGVAPADLTHPAFRGMGGDLGLSGTRARKIVLLEPDAARNARIAVAFTSGAPAMLTREVGDGRVGLLTTTIDRDWADLPLRPGFVPLVTGTLTYLGGARGTMAGSQIPVGAPRSIRTGSPVVISTPDGREVSVAPEDGTAVFRETFEVGHYRIRSSEDESVFAVEVDPAESETQRVDLPDQTLEEERREVSVSVPRWREIVLLIALLLGLEAGLRWRRPLRKV